MYKNSCDKLNTKTTNMDRPDFRTLPYDLGNELEDLKNYKKDLEKYTDFIENERDKQLFLYNVGVSFTHELIQKETALRTKLSENLDLYKSTGNMQMYERTFDLWNKQNLVLWDLKDILCRMGVDID